MGQPLTERPKEERTLRLCLLDTAYVPSFQASCPNVTLSLTDASELSGEELIRGLLDGTLTQDVIEVYAAALFPAMADKDYLVELTASTVLEAEHARLVSRASVGRVPERSSVRGSGQPAGALLGVSAGAVATRAAGRPTPAYHRCMDGPVPCMAPGGAHDVSAGCAAGGAVRGHAASVHCAVRSAGGGVLL